MMPLERVPRKSHPMCSHLEEPALDGDPAENSDPNEDLRQYVRELTAAVKPAPRAAFFHCPTFSFDAFKIDVLRNRGYYAYPPRGLQCLTTVVEEMGIETHLVDLNFLMLERLKKGNFKKTPDLYELLSEILDDFLARHPGIGVFGVSTGVIVSDLFAKQRHPFLEVLRHLLSETRGIVLAGGPVATLESGRILQEGLAHFVFKGEAEDRIRYLLGLVFEKQKLVPYSGICFRSGRQVLESTGSSMMVDFKQSIIPTYRQIAVERYSTVGCLSPFSRMAGVDKPYASLQLIRGCRMHCTFCGLIQYRGSNKVLQYPTDILFDELRYLVQRRGVRHFEWLDEDLLAVRPAIVEFMNRVIRENIQVTWAANIGVIAVCLTDDILDLMARSGCIGFRIGIESGNDEILKRIRKPATKPRLRDVGLKLRRYPEFFVCGCYIIGFKNETYRQMFDTLLFALEMNLSWAQFAIYQDIGDSDETATAQVDQQARPGTGEKHAAQDFIPSPQKVVGSTVVGTASHARLSPQELFQMPLDAPHDTSLKDQYWFAYNLIVNYLSNKNLRPGGRVDQFLGWVGALEITYPHHPVIALFLCLANLIKGEAKAAEIYREKARALLDTSDDWRNKFELFSLDRLLDIRESDRDTIPGELDRIVQSYRLPS